ncbi:hypothetical protein BD410DRAFT_810458 [Rickenella mellea]|uniref:Uncharacterized protein n=1 Tax=Rickenella mellea TaxID=50990 RepID=A0A4Y7PE59_9AGAM|nr:hypothetical protein BD410DRAFT_810458 [Rickenella mellea]
MDGCGRWRTGSRGLREGKRDIKELRYEGIQAREFLENCGHAPLEGEEMYRVPGQSHLISSHSYSTIKNHENYEDTVSLSSGPSPPILGEALSDDRLLSIVLSQATLV